ncbi:MAG TPA: hypothetical protein VGN15_10765 [Ktedonobacteraceae bacterium]|nr:hypothetical protein [Ktedonobacteraceae bacterium]
MPSTLSQLVEATLAGQLLLIFNVIVRGVNVGDACADSVGDAVGWGVEAPLCDGAANGLLIVHALSNKQHIMPHSISIPRELICLTV